jgi:hypothetical protein
MGHRVRSGNQRPSSAPSAGGQLLILRAFGAASGGGLAHTRGEMTPPRAASRRYFPSSPFKPPLAPPPPEVFAIQDQVTHDKYGLGRVMSIEDGTSVVIDFRTHRVRIMTPYARLTKL